MTHSAPTMIGKAFIYSFSGDMIAASAGIAKGKFALAGQKPDRQGGPDTPALFVKGNRRPR